MESKHAFDPKHDDCLSTNIDNIVSLISWRAQIQPEDTAFVFLDRGEDVAEQLNYSELNRRVEALARRLCRMGLSGSSVLLMYPQSIDYLVGMFACFKAGCVAISAYPPSRNYARTLKTIIEDACPKAVLSRTELYARSVETDGIDALRVLDPIFSDQQNSPLELNASENCDLPQVSPRNLALLQYTSGSTTSPRGVMVHHDNLMANLASLQAAFQHPRPSNIVSWLPLYHDMGLVSKAFFGLYRGCTVVLMSPLSFFQKPIRWLRAISIFQAHSSGGPNFAFERCVQAISEADMEGLDLRCWKHAYNGAEPIRAETMSRFANKFRRVGFEASSLYPCYGMAEACVFVSGGLPQSGAKSASFDRDALGQGKARRIRLFDQGQEASGARANDGSDSKFIELVSCGRTWRDETVRIVDPESGIALDDCNVGEIWIRGPSVCRGYWGDPESHRNTFGQVLRDERRSERSDERSCDSIYPFLRTGDLGFVEGGELYITGRIKDLLIVHGQNYYPQDIEGVVVDAVGQLRPTGTVAFSSLENGTEALILVCEINREAIKQNFGQICVSIQKAVETHIGLQATEIVLLKPGRVPRTSSGKLQRSRCRCLWKDGTLSPLYRWRNERIEVGRLSEVSRASTKALLSSKMRMFKVAVLEALRQGAAEKLSLGLDEIGGDANLIRRGLHSIQLVELSHQVQELFGRPVEVADIFEDASLEVVASAICQRWMEKDANQLDLEDSGRQGSPGREAKRLAETVELSYGQRAMWAVHCRDPDSIIYNIHLSLSLSSPVDVDILVDSLRQMVLRHEALRTKIIEHDGRPQQIVETTATVDFLHVDGRTWTEEQESAWVESNTRKPFELASETPIRIRMLSRGADQHRLLFVIHHICFDFWSLVIFANELGAIYRAKTQGNQANLRPLPANYRSFVAWQQAYLDQSNDENREESRKDNLEQNQEKKQDEHWKFWRNYLQGKLPQLRLPYDKPEGTNKAYRGGIVNVALSVEQSQGLAELGRNHGATVYSVTLACFSELLRRFCRQEDMVIGTPTAGRPDARFHGLLGYFVNPVAIRLQPSGHQSFVTFLDHVRSNVQQVLCHQNFPFSTIVERLNPRRSATRWPIYQVAFTFQNVQMDSECDWGALSIGWPQTNMKWGGLSVGSAQIEERVENFDLKLVMCSHKNRFVASFQYDCERFEAETMQSLAQAWLRLVEEIVKHPELPLDTLSKFENPAASGEHLPSRRLDSTSAKVCVGAMEEKRFEQHFLQIAAKHADRPAIADHGRVWSYRELEHRSHQLAGTLAEERGDDQEPVVGILLPRGAPFVASMLAIWKSGFVLLPLDSELPEERIRWILGDADVQVLITSGENVGRFSDLCRCVDVEQKPTVSDEKLALERFASGPGPFESGPSESRPPESGILESTAYIIYTSGSTGEPKGVEVSHGALMNLIRWHVETYAVTCRDKATQIASMGFDACVWEIFPYLFAGAQLVFVPDELRGDSRRLVDWMNRQEITMTFLPTPLAESLLQETWPCDVQLGRMLVGGDRLHVVKKPQGLEALELFNHYGPTEATVVSTAGKVVQNGQFPHIGQAIANVEVFVLDGALMPVREGEVGELCIAGANLGRGYRRRPGQTAERFVPNPFSGILGSRMYRSGDLVRRRSDGNIEFVGRVDEQTKVRGNRIEPREVEQWLAKIPMVQQSSVVVVSNERDENQLAAYVVFAPECNDVDQKLEGQHVEFWSTLYDQTYADNQKPPGEFDITGWKSSYSGDDIEAGDMELWLKDTTEQILSLAPKRIFEIGCGTGLILFRVAPKVSHYQGIDISQVAIDRVRCQIATRGWKHVQVDTAVAHELERYGAENRYDTFVLNSVVQYFPSLNYLNTVLRQIVGLVGTGQIWLGDVRDFDLLRTFHTDVQVEKCPDWLTVGELRERIKSSLLNDHELCISMDAMQKFAEDQPGVSGMEVRLHRGNGSRELSCFRYHVVLHIGESKNFFEPQWQPWNEENFLHRLESYLRHESPAHVSICGILNRRMQSVLDRFERVMQASSEDVVSLIRREGSHVESVGVEPEQLWQLGDRLGYRVDLLRSTKDGIGAFSAVFRRWGHECVGWALDSRRDTKDKKGEAPLLSTQERSKQQLHANLPTRHLLSTRRIDEVKRELAKVVPRYMVPDHWVELEQLPMTRNGKVDRSALPPLHRTRRFFVAPRNQLERRLAAIWTQLLGAGSVGIHDNFFELGGDSILSIQMVSRAKDQGISLQARDVFAHQTVEELARFVEPSNRNSEPGKFEDEANTTGEHELQDAISTDNKDAVGETLSSSPLRILDLTPLQYGLLFESLTANDQHAYVEQIRFRLHGVPNIEALRSAWRGLQERYSTLRSAFDVSAAVPKRRIWSSDQVELPFSVLDWSHLGVGDAHVETEFHRWMERERKKGFDFGTAPLMRIYVVLRENQQLDMVWTHHHLILDGWSVSLLVSELFERYREICETSQLNRGAESDPQDVVRWCQQQDESEERAFWKGYWGNEGLHPELVEHGFHGFRQSTKKDDCREDRGERISATERISFEFPAELSRRLAQFSREKQLPLSSVLQASFAWLLGHYQNSSFAQFGMVVSGRNADVENISHQVGLLINTVPVRVHIPVELEVLRWIKELNASTQSVLAHSFCSLPQMQKWLNADRSQPLFSVLFSIENYPLGRWQEQRFGGLEIGEIQYIGHTHYPLTVVVIPGESIRLRVGYSTSKFSRKWIETFCRNFQSVCERLLSQVDKQVWQIGQHGTLLAKEDATPFNSKDARTTPNFKLSSLTERFGQILTRHASRVALISTDHRCPEWSYEALDQKANQVCAALEQAGVGHGDRVGLWVASSFELIACMLGALKRGAVYVPIDPELPDARVQYILNDARVSVIIGAQPNQHLVVDQSRVFLSFAEIFDVSIASPNRATLQSLGPSDIAYIIYTSGSTGSPKGVAISHGQVSRLLDACQQRISFNELDTWVLLHSPSFDFSVWEIWGALLSGARLLVISSWEKLDPRLCWQAIERHRVSILNCTPSAFYPLSEYAVQLHLDSTTSDSAVSKPSLVASKPFLRYVIFGGEKLRPSQLQSWEACFGLENPKLVNMYGITETTVHVTSHEVCTADIDHGEAVVGKGLDDLPVYVVGQSHELLPRGVVGEVYVGGAGLGMGYVGKPGETSARFIPDPWGREPGSRMYRSGDLGYWNEGGNLVVVGRADHQVKLRGFRLELGEVEAQLLKAPGVKECAVGVEEDSGAVQALVGYVVEDTLAQKNQTNQTNEKDWEAWLERRLPDYMVPRRWLRLSKLPLTPNGKLDREKLPRFERKLRENAADERPLDQEEKQLAEIWRDVLLGAGKKIVGEAQSHNQGKILVEANPPSLSAEGQGSDEEGAKALIGRYTNFFELGGDSIQAMQIVNRARAIGLEITAQDLFEGQSIVTVLSRLKDRAKNRRQVRESVPEEFVSDVNLVESAENKSGHIEMTPIQQWFFEQNFSRPSHFNQALLLSVEAGSWTEAGLKWCLQAMCREHISLAMRYRKVDGAAQGASFVQISSDGQDDWPVEWVDVSHLHASEQEKVMAERNAWAQSHLNLEQGPLCRAVYFQTGHTPGQESGQGKQDRLLLVVHHLAVDGVSWRILLEDLQVSRGRLDAVQSTTSVAKIMGRKVAGNESPHFLRSRRMSHAQWAKVLQTYVLDHGAKEFEDWKKLPWDRVRPLWPRPCRIANTIENRRAIIHRLGADDTRKLLQVAQGVFQVQVSDVLLAVLAPSFAKFFSMEATMPSLVRVDVEGHGREALYEDQDLSRTVGWFTSIFPVLLDLNPIEIRDRIIQTHKQFQSMPHRGVGFSALRYFASKTVRDEIRTWPQAEISFNYLGRFPEEWGSTSGMFGGGALEHEVTRQQQHGQNHCPYRVDVNLSIVGANLWMHWSCSHGEDEAIVEAIAREYFEQLRSLTTYSSSHRPSADTSQQPSLGEASLESLPMHTQPSTSLSSELIADVLELIED